MSKKLLQKLLSDPSFKNTLNKLNTASLNRGIATSSIEDVARAQSALPVLAEHRNKRANNKVDNKKNAEKLNWITP